MEGGGGGGKCSNATAVHPKDTSRIAYILHFILGAGNLLPWNAFITAVDYFGHLFPGRHVEKVFAVVYMGSSLLVLLLLLSSDSCRRRLSFRLRMNVGFSMFVLSLMATPVMNWGGNVPYAPVVAFVMICGLADGLIGGSLVGTAGKLPRQYMQAIFAGTASSGVLMSILRMTTKASLPATPQGLKTSAQFYFILSSAILLGCIVCCNFLYKLPVMKQHYNYHLHDDRDFSACKFMHLFTKLGWPAFGIFLIYTVTLSIFPGFLAEDIESTALGDWYPIILIATYNASDFAGKSLTGVHVLKSVGKATWGSVLRLLFYPLYVGCFRGPEWMRSEAPVVVLTVMLGLSNGYLTSVIMILSPKEVPPPEAEVAAVVMAVMLGLGLVVGSVMGWFWII